ncbi:hypothetical protein T484DRAFT_1818882, partial [Baffinella frigidus]
DDAVARAPSDASSTNASSIADPEKDAPPEALSFGEWHALAVLSFGEWHALAVLSFGEWHALAVLSFGEWHALAVLSFGEWHALAVTVRGTDGRAPGAVAVYVDGVAMGEVGLPEGFSLFVPEDDPRVSLVYARALSLSEGCGVTTRGSTRRPTHNELHPPEPVGEHFGEQEIASPKKKKKGEDEKAASSTYSSVMHEDEPYGFWPMQEKRKEKRKERPCRDMKLSDEMENLLLAGVIDLPFPREMAYESRHGGSLLFGEQGPPSVHGLAVGFQGGGVRGLEGAMCDENMEAAP